MSGLSDYLAGLEGAARAASAREEEYRREFAKKVREHEQERAFAFRRLNLMKAIGESVSGAKDEDEAKAKGQAAFERELGWTGATEMQRQTTEHFLPVVMASWRAAQPGTVESQAVSSALADFEVWYANNRKGPFLTLLEQEAVELPLVET